MCRFDHDVDHAHALGFFYDPLILAYVNEDGQILYPDPQGTTNSKVANVFKKFEADAA